MTRLTPRLQPAALIGTPPVARALMAAAVPRLAASRDGAPRALEAALRTAAVGRIPADERAWAARIEARRRELLASAETIDVWNAEFHGAVETRAAAWWISLPPVWCRLLARIVRELRPRSGLELGTAFGISACYQAAALELGGRGRLVTLDVAEWAEAAELNFAHLGLTERVELRRGDIEATLPGVLAENPELDYVFIDAEHTEEATIAYFDAICPRLAPEAVVVIDDVTWPEGGRRAWRTIRDRPQIARSINLGRVGIVVARP